MPTGDDGVKSNFLSIMTTTYGRTATPCVLACLLASAASADSKGHAWLRKHGTVLLAGATHDVSKSPFNMATYLAVGYNALWDAVPSARLFDLAEQHRVPWFCNGVKGRLDSPFAGGLKLFDEPHFRKASSLDGSERVFRPHLSGVPGPLGVGIGGPRYRGLRFLNLIGMDTDGDPVAVAKRLWGDEGNPGYTYAQYVEDVLNIWQPDIVMHDHYPYNEKRNPQRYLFSQTFYRDTDIIRAAALKRGRPYWRYLQAYGKVNDKAMPSKSQIRLELFTGLAYGFTGFVHYWYDLPHDRDRGLVCAFFTADREPRGFYRHAAEAVPEIARLGRSAIHLLSTDVRYVPCDSTKELPKGVTSWRDTEHPLARTDPYQKRIEVSGRGPDSDFLVGYFMDGQGERYFMPVNVRHEPDSRKHCTESVTIDFDFDDTPIKQLRRINRRTGKEEIVDKSSPIFSSLGEGCYRLVLSLPGGTGDLFKYDTGAPFVGIESKR